MDEFAKRAEVDRDHLGRDWFLGDRCMRGGNLGMAPVLIVLAVGYDD